MDLADEPTLFFCEQAFVIFKSPEAADGCLRVHKHHKWRRTLKGVMHCGCLLSWVDVDDCPPMPPLAILRVLAARTVFLPTPSTSSHFQNPDAHAAIARSS